MFFNEPLLSTAYFPPVEYFFVLANCSSAVIEACESYQKQSYRNRCRIYATGGVESLSVPVIHSAEGSSISATEIDYSRGWLHQHCLAIRSAYGSTPFFEYYWDDLEAILLSKHQKLIDLNVALTQQIAEMIGLRCRITLSERYTPVMPAPGDCQVSPLLKMAEEPTAKEVEMTDLRNRIHPKHKGASLMEEQGAIKEYYQVFSDRCGFIPNLSILDLLFHEGPQSADYLIL